MPFLCDCAGGGLSLLPGRQHLHVPGARVRAQRGRPAVPRAAAGGVPGAAAARAGAAGAAEPPRLRAGPRGRLRPRRAGAAGRAPQRYAGRGTGHGISAAGALERIITDELAEQ